MSNRGLVPELIAEMGIRLADRPWGAEEIAWLDSALRPLVEELIAAREALSAGHDCRCETCRNALAAYDALVKGQEG